MRRHKAFTLVELLVVIAVISILVALLVPTLKKAMETSALVQCKHNLQTLIMAVQEYATKFDRSLPFNNWLGAGKDANWKNTYNAAGWLYEYPINPVPEEVETGSLWPYIRSRESYRCPRHDPPYNRGNAEKLTSYLMNGAVSRYANAAQMVPYKIHQMPSDAICFWEVDETQAGDYWNDGSNIPSQPVTRRHDEGGTVVCFDGHVEWIARTAFDVERTKYPGRLWCAPTSNGQ